MRFLFRLLLLFVVLALVWVFRQPIMERLNLAAGTSARPNGSDARASGGAERTERGPLSDLDFSVEAIAQELRATGRVVRRKVSAAGRRLAESTRDARTTAKLKARFALDPELKTREIEVDTDDGRVTLRGRVESDEEVARAIRMAAEEDDVLEVISTLQPRRGARPTASPRP